MTELYGYAALPWNVEPYDLDPDGDVRTMEIGLERATKKSLERLAALAAVRKLNPQN
jgi:hypothetical protein